ncbi:hypothetical protein HanRHA438_Chr08g0367971 [Helianthus annuus]|uniref:Uncharacterized protein n=1 Tax=Helianthus annuus TaxID=4232 RepID=A0A251U990_HELAN|nr:hypothetical protein HanXRQr2_Chr08g0355801 [Helianthus annuus]KAJ0548459.1 hypothetical protein HanIR_Chr08g0384041 [Helianthus annuus]KAJ0899387.1 hypothetical protein HanRHA438_Chr08g0367971 [Helianthus annuus]KAJ0902972.1 hypothetical protein HanPSC8_Chr08g0343581 [Helianthus annuus]
MTGRFHSPGRQEREGGMSRWSAGERRETVGSRSESPVCVLEQDKGNGTFWVGRNASSIVGDESDRTGDVEEGGGVAD